MSVNSTKEVVRLRLNQTFNENSIENSIIQNVASIIGEVVKEYNASYEDTTYREIYILCQQFARNISDTLASENTNRNMQLGPNKSSISDFLT